MLNFIQTYGQIVIMMLIAVSAYYLLLGVYAKHSALPPFLELNGKWEAENGKLLRPLQAMTCFSSS